MQTPKADTKQPPSVLQKCCRNIVQSVAPSRGSLHVLPPVTEGWTTLKNQGLSRTSVTMNFSRHTELEGRDEFNTNTSSSGGFGKSSWAKLSCLHSLAGAAACPELAHGNSMAFVL